MFLRLDYLFYICCDKRDEYNMQSMKKLLLSLMLSAAAMQLHAEGYQINSLSSKQQGMAHTGTAMKLGSESVYFNPAALSFQR